MLKNCLANGQIHIHYDVLNMAFGQKSTTRRRFLGRCLRLLWFEAFGQTRWAAKVRNFKTCASG